MRVVPAIDLKDGRCVRLHQGRAESARVYADDPGDQARRFVEAGARWIHVVDLDGAFAGAPRNAAAIEAIRAAGACIELGGGLRTPEAVEAALSAGVEKVVLGTLALTRPELLPELCARHPGRIVVAVDARGDEVAVAGWTEGSGRRLLDVAAEAREAGAAGLLYTDIERDGTGQGVNVEATARLAARAGLPVIASGGVRDLEDLDALARHPGIEAAVVGRALYEGQVALAEALRRHHVSTLLEDPCSHAGSFPAST